MDIKNVKTRCDWPATVLTVVKHPKTGVEILRGTVLSPIAGYYIECTWTLEGQCWYGRELDIVE